MARPKGSHNKPKNNGPVMTVENIDERIAVVEAQIDDLSGQMKSLKAELKQLQKEKEKAERAALEKKAAEDRETILAAFAASGKSVEEVLELLK